MARGGGWVGRDLVWSGPVFPILIRIQLFPAPCSRSTSPPSQSLTRSPSSFSSPMSTQTVPKTFPPSVSLTSPDQTDLIHQYQKHSRLDERDGRSVKSNETTSRGNVSHSGSGLSCVKNLTSGSSLSLSSCWAG